MVSDAPAELLDVVDADDRVLGQLPRAEVHALRLRHRAVHILVNDSRGRLFLQKRSLTKDTNPGLWDTSAAGHVDAGETPLAAAVRELHEELGLRLDPGALEPLFRLAPEPTRGNEFVSVYRVVCDLPMTLEAGEIEAGCWLDADGWAARLRDDPDRFTSVLRDIVERAGIVGAADR